VLSIVVGGHVEGTLSALGAGRGGTAPAVLNNANGSFVAGVDLGALVNTGSEESHAIVRAEYTTDRNGGDVVGHGRITLPPAVVQTAVRSALQVSR
jgi:hypothetical protein